METNINTYNLSQDGKQFLLQSSLIGNRLRLSCKSVSNQKIKFVREFTIEELKQLDKIFSSITTPYEALQCFDTIMKNQKMSISESFEVINIKFYIKTEEEEHQMELPFIEEYTSSTKNENIITDFQNLNLNNLNTTEMGYSNYDTNINIENIDTTYNIPITSTTYENVSDNYWTSSELKADEAIRMNLGTVDKKNNKYYSSIKVAGVQKTYQYYSFQSVNYSLKVRPFLAF